MSSPTAGQGTPYWYEWTVGLVKVVEMMRPDSGITSVSFQEEGVKGWDDVVVRHGDGRIDYIQVKHTREGTNLTFGAFLTPDKKGETLLGNLYQAWLDLGLSSKSARCIVYTNREAGEREFLGRPPLLEFTRWLKKESAERTTLHEVKVPEKWKPAWEEWLGQVSFGSDEARLDFFRALSIETNQPDLNELRLEVLSDLATTFGTSVTKATPLLQGLSDALSVWTGDYDKVTAEDVAAALALPEELEILKLAPPPPAPFFPTREREAADLEQMLVATESPSIIFLCAEPGAGKTSLLSRIEMRRSDKVLSGVVGLRYFAFLPITPESQGSPTETDYSVNPERLWYSLLSQLRSDLSGKLWDYVVPVRNEILTWQQARDHVLRIADRIGRELGRKFVIVIDGIDHAARAGRLRYEPALAFDFFRSLPGPEELEGKEIRLLVAGQPAADYDEYPSWLKGQENGVLQVDLRSLTKADVAELLSGKNPGFPTEDWDRAIDTITDETSGNTLAVVFAVEEASSCSSAEQLRLRLGNRRLRSGLRAYYQSIWQYAFSEQSQADGILGAEIAIAGTLCFVREGISGEIMASAFPGLGYSSDYWHLALAKLSPLVVDRGSGFQVLHNDIRVFLANYFGERRGTERSWVAGCLADYYCSPTSNRRVAHASLYQLLRTAGRQSEWARAFDVRWVFEAAALGEPFQEVALQCKEALSAAVDLRDWDVLLQVACATETLERWENCRRGASSRNDEAGSEAAPFFPPSELMVLPMESWTIDNLRGVTTDAKRIARGGELERAKALLKRWFAGLTIGELATLTYPPNDEHEAAESISRAADSWFRNLGDVSRTVRFSLDSEDDAHPMHNRAEYFYEEGWAAASCELGPFRSLSSCFLGLLPRFHAHLSTSVRTLATRDEWRLVARLLRICYEDRSTFPDDFKMLAGWWCVRSGLQMRCPGWLESLDETDLMLSNGQGEDIEALVAIARARGWLNTAAESSDIARDIFARTAYAKTNKTGLRVLLNAAVVLGQVASLQAQGKAEAIRILFRPDSVGQIASALWGKAWMDKSDPLWLSKTAGSLSSEWVKTFFPLDQAYREALLAAGTPVAELAPGDHRVESVWLLLKLAGARERLAAWCRNAIGDDGWIWTEGSDSREETAREFFLGAAREIGESHLADQAEERLKWQRIGYVGHKDYSFRWVSNWFDELSAADPSVVRDQGLRLLTLLDACHAQGGDNRWSSDLHASVGAAAIASGPADVWSVMFSDRRHRGNWRWYNSVKILFLDGFLDRLNRPMPMEEMITCWCISISLARWYDTADVAVICRIRDAILNSCASATERQGLEELFRRISPGEWHRKPLKEDEDEREREHRPTGDVDWRKEVASANRLDPFLAAAVVREIIRENSETLDNELTQVLELFGQGNSMSGGWGHYPGELKQPLSDIIRSVPDSKLWSLARAAILRANEGGYWYSSVCENLQALLLTRSSVRGRDALQSGFERVIDMHERLARGGDLSITLPETTAADSSRCETWERFACEVFAVLFSSRYVTVLESAFTGLDAFVSWKPTVIPHVFDAFGQDAWRARWLLTLAEPWAVKFPTEMEFVMEKLASYASNGSLSIRLQAWIVQILASRIHSRAVPSFEFARRAYEDAPSAKQVHDILETGAEMHGAFRLVDRHKFALSSIERVHDTTGEDFSDVRLSIGAKLIQLDDCNESERPWQERIKNNHDLKCRGERGGLALDREYDRVISDRLATPGHLLRFAQGHLGSEDGWILRQSPVPHPLLPQWPSERALAGDYHHPPSSREVLDSLRPLALEGIDGNEVVLAACLEASSWRDHFRYDYWLQESEDAPDPGEHMPTTLNGRTFAWMAWDDWWEPRKNKGRRCICFSVGGQQHLLNCFPKMIPSKLWITELGWSPSTDNPFVWLKGEQPVVRFEILHGPPHSHDQNAGRLETVHRWVVKTAAFESTMKAMPLLKAREQFSRIPLKEQ
jgi:hypothetical protein